MYLFMLNKMQYNTTALSIIIFYWNKVLHITRNLIRFYETENESGLYVLLFCGPHTSIPDVLNKRATKPITSEAMAITSIIIACGSDMVVGF